MSAIQIVMHDDEAQVFSPYSAVNVVKAVPSFARRWNATKPRCWWVRRAFVVSLAESLRAAGYAVFITNEDGTPWTPPRPSGRGSTPAAGWVEQAFADCPVDRVDKVRRALLIAHHPDHGGDPELAKRINAAADARLRGGGRR